MPLTPAEVHNVAFKKPPIGKRGYDEEEVDAFLDIVEVELSRLIEENNDLRARVATGTQTISPEPTAVDSAASGAAAEAAAAELSAAREDNQRLQSHIAELERAMTQGKSGAQQQVVQLQQQLAQSEQTLAEQRRELETARQSLAEAQQAAAATPAPAAASSNEHHAQAVQMLALAQQTADQHLAQSKAEAERMLAEAQAHAQSQLSEAQSKSAQHVSDAESRAKQLDEESNTRAAQTVKDAEQRAATITAQFEQRKGALERRVEELRVYEREYRTRLRGYLESQLRDLDASGRAEPAATGGQGEDHAEASQG